MTRTSPTANVMFPIQSIGAGSCTPISRSLRCDQTVPKMPNGTETRKTSRQLIGASRPPSEQADELAADADDVVQAEREPALVATGTRR